MFRSIVLGSSAITPSTKKSELGVSLVEMTLLVSAISIISIASLSFLGGSIGDSFRTASRSAAPSNQATIDYQQDTGGGEDGGGYGLLDGGGTSSGMDNPCNMGDTPGFSDEGYCFPDGNTQAVQ